MMHVKNVHILKVHSYLRMNSFLRTTLKRKTEIASEFINNNNKKGNEHLIKCEFFKLKLTNLIMSQGIVICYPNLDFHMG